jgi:hypothetical protein
VEFTVPAGNAERAAFGLNDGDTNQSYGEIDYAFYTHKGHVLIFERGRYVGGFVPYTAGDRLRISVSAGLVRYWQNGALLDTSSLPARTPLRVDTSLRDPGVTIKEAVLAGDLSDVADGSSGGGRGGDAGGWRRSSSSGELRSSRTASPGRRESSRSTASRK